MPETNRNDMKLLSAKLTEDKKSCVSNSNVLNISYFCRIIDKSAEEENTQAVQRNNTAHAGEENIRGNKENAKV